MFHYQTFLIFAYLQAREQARENIRFSVLKNSGADSMKGGDAATRGAPLGGAAFLPPLLSHPGGERRDESRLYVADILWLRFSIR